MVKDLKLSVHIVDIDSLMPMSPFLGLFGDIIESVLLEVQRRGLFRREVDGEGTVAAQHSLVAFLLHSFLEA